MAQKLKEAGKDIDVKVTTQATLISFDLPERMSDEEIEADLSEKHLFDIGEVYGVIAGLIAKQPAGEEGVLLSNGYSNIFYTEKKVVSVLWDGDGWNVNLLYPVC